MFLVNIVRGFTVNTEEILETDIKIIWMFNTFRIFYRISKACICQTRSLSAGSIVRNLIRHIFNIWYAISCLQNSYGLFISCLQNSYWYTLAV